MLASAIMPAQHSYIASRSQINAKKCSKLHPVMQPAATIDNYITISILEVPFFHIYLKVLDASGHSITTV